MKRLITCGLILAAITFEAGAQVSVTGGKRYTDAKLGLTAVTGDVELPAGGVWSVVEPGRDSGLSQVQLVLSPEEQNVLRGNRAQKAEKAMRIEAERYPMWSLYHVCTEYGRTNNGIGPASWDDVTSNKVRNIPHEFSSLKTNYFLIPSVLVRIGGTAVVARLPLALQLHPVAADGKHWVLFNDGQSERVPIDKALCAKYGVVVESTEKPELKQPKPAPDKSRYVITALLKATGKQQLMVSSETTGKSIQLTWDTGQAADGGRDVISKWAESRAMNWLMLAANGDAPVLRHWLSRCDALYGAHMPDLGGDGNMRRGETADAFSVLGGRAAVRETLQMQSLRQAGAANAQENTAIETLKGVEVKSHPFDEMLKSVKPGELALADNVPSDRAFVYFPKPDALLPFLDEGGDFIFRGGSVALANPVAYNLKERYVERLALTDKWVRDLLLKSGAIKEMAMFLPDLFFIDGTEVTIVARAPAAQLLKPALGLLGIGSLSEAIQEKTGKAGKSYWAMDGDLLIISTSRGEVERVLALRKAKGAGSLGRSAEFRYMLAQMPVQPGTRFLCYLSDPFIRRLVGPEVKIGQLRRLIAKGEMENASAAALLYRLDGQQGQADIQALIAKGYLAAEPATARGSTLDERFAASCPAYGSPGSLKTILENPVKTVTSAEAEAYKAYMENYSRFWRQYFDPMAFRLDDGPGGELKLTTFILPLIDNSIYNGLKGVVRRKEDNTPLRVPDLNPKPLALLSANLSEEVWTKVTQNMFSELLQRYTTLNPAAFDKIGPSVHLAVYDADPIITFGAGDALGVLGAPMLERGGSTMLFIPVIASILTRPCQLIVELQEPDVVRKMMLAASTAPLGRDRRWDPTVNFCKVAGRDAWICTISIENIVRVRFGVEIKDKYLILSNLPWSQKPGFGPTRDADMNALALDLHPEAGVLQMPGLFMAACEQERVATVQGQRYLYPLLACGAASVSEAADKCRALFGYAPEHPGRGQWLWENGRLSSSTYGDTRHPMQPEYKTGDQLFGALGGLDTLNLNLQFEDAGLRVVTRWKMKSESGAR